MEEKNIKFEDLGLSENVLRALEEYGYKKPTEIQVKTIPYILDKRDVIGQSQTGTGKTASFGLPLIESINPEFNKVQAIILCPTRELATQVTGELRKFTKYKESYVITITDKLSALKSFYEYYQSHLMKKKFLRYAYIFFAFSIFKLNI